MVDSGNKIDFRWFEWIIGREMNVQEKYTATVWTVILHVIKESIQVSQNAEY